MKKFFVFALILGLFCNTAFASTIYLPTESSTQYLPTVKILTFSLGYDGTLTGEGYGSGTLIDSRGTILTNNHVIEDYYDPTMVSDAFQICLTRSNAVQSPVCEMTASFIARDKEKDLALLRIDKKDVRGDSIDFDFYLPYENSAALDVGSALTVIGYPDTGGRTITYTSGLLSGFVTEGGLTYVKTDADISFGNSGGTAVNENGDLIGVPTYVIESAETLGYLYPLEDAVSWIKEHINDSASYNEVAKSQLKDEITASIDANEKGIYRNDYPPYEISLIDGWKFGNSLEGSFESENYGSYYGEDSVVIYPDHASDEMDVFIELSVTDYSYIVEISDIVDILNSYNEEYSYTDTNSSVIEEVKFNGYDAVKESYSYYDWWYDKNYTDVTYYIPFGDKVINIFYSYSEDDSSLLSDIEDILDTFEVDMDDITVKVVNSVKSEDPYIEVVNPSKDLYLSDDSYEYDGDYYFGASFGKKGDYDFAIDIYSNDFWYPEHMNNFALFQEDTTSDAEAWMDIISQGELRIDGHDGFFITDEYEDYLGEMTIYTSIYIDNGADYFAVYYSGEEESYDANMSSLKAVLKNIKLDNNGEGSYLIPSFKGTRTGGVLQDIENYVYEDSIRYLSREGAFGDLAPAYFNPAGELTREDFVLWLGRSLSGEAYTDYLNFESAFGVCENNCFEDVEKESAVYPYVHFLKQKGILKGTETGGRSYFHPNQQISLAAALKILFEVYEFEVWDAPEFIPWYLPYLQLAYKENVLPYGVDDVNYLLTRGEGAFLIDNVQYSSSYGGYWY